MDAGLRNAALPLGTLNARDFGLKGDGISNDQPALAALVDRAARESRADGVPRVVYCPPGRYVLADAATIWRNGVSLVGAGVGATRFLLTNRGRPDAAVSLARFTEREDGAGRDNPLLDCTFAGFEIDGSGVELSRYDPRAKGLDLQYMMRATFQDLYIHHTAATGLGCDHLQDSVIEDVFAMHCGRLNDGEQPGGAGIGIGIGGWGGLERTSLNDCIAHGNATNGIFVELQKGKWPPPRGIKILGCHCTGNRFGISDWGADGLCVADCQLLDNLVAGFDVSSRGVAGVAGRDGVLSACVIDGNLEDGVRIEGTPGPYVVRGCRISNNRKCGFRQFGRAPAPESPREIVLEGNGIRANGLEGVRFERAVADACLWGNRIRDNGRLGEAADLEFAQGMTGLWLSDNRIGTERGRAAA